MLYLSLYYLYYLYFISPFTIIYDNLWIVKHIYKKYYTKQQIIYVRETYNHEYDIVELEFNKITI